MKELVIASNNPGKIREIQQILAPLELQIITQSELNIEEAEEPHATFVENALAKARHAARCSGRMALADDSGICVHALNGAPGVYSARFAGEPKSDERNNTELLSRLAKHTDRRAYYYCVIVLVRHVDDPQPIIAEGEWRGEILAAPRGSGGFGYDPLFLLPEMGKSAAELSAHEKNRISHRAQALVQLIHKLEREPNLLKHTFA